MNTLNKLQRENITIGQQASGENISIDVFTIEGEKPGPCVYLQSSMHGAELQGSAVIYSLIKHFLHHSFQGKIIFVPNANPCALNLKMGQYTYGRFNPITGENWNRLYIDITKINTIKEIISSFAKKFGHLERSELIEKFTSLLDESTKLEFSKILKTRPSLKMHLTLQSLAISSNIVLDLHTGPKATRYIYSQKSHLEEAKHFEFPFYILIPPSFHGAMDEASFSPWNYLEKELQILNIAQSKLFSSYTLELGNEENISLEDSIQDCSNIINYLNHKGIKIKEISSPQNIKSYYCELQDFKTYYSSSGGLVDYMKMPGDLCKKGEVLSKTLNFKKDNIDEMISEFKSPNDCIIINQFASSSVSSGSELFQVMEKYFS